MTISLKQKHEKYREFFDSFLGKDWIEKNKSIFFAHILVKKTDFYEIFCVFDKNCYEDFSSFKYADLSIACELCGKMALPYLEINFNYDVVTNIPFASVVFYNKKFGKRTLDDVEYICSSTKCEEKLYNEILLALHS